MWASCQHSVQRRLLNQKYALRNSLRFSFSHLVLCSAYLFNAHILLCMINVYLYLISSRKGQIFVCSEVHPLIWEMRFSLWWLWRLQASGLWHHVVWSKSTNISEEPSSGMLVDFYQAIQHHIAEACLIFHLFTFYMCLIHGAISSSTPHHIMRVACILKSLSFCSNYYETFNSLTLNAIN